jgi:hypothetical protein
MKLYKIGDKSKAVCSTCKAVRPTTFQERDVPMRSGRGLVRDVLVAVCDVCGEVVAIPHQSAPRIAETLRHTRHNVEARVPRQLFDVVALVGQELGGGPEGGSLLFRYYLERATSNRQFRTRLPALAVGGDASGRASARFSAKLTEVAYGQLVRLQKATRLRRTEVVKGMMVQMKHDILDRRSPAVRKDLERFVRLAG